MLELENTRIAVIGLGYVGLPLALAYSQHYPTIGYDLNAKRVSELQNGNDQTGEADPQELKQAVQQHHLTLTTDENMLDKANVFIVTVPTPINEANQPDLTPLISSSTTIGKHLSKGDIVIYESTTYPTCTQQLCAPILQAESHLKYNQDFFCGYSPERINPADKVNRLQNIKKITSGSTPEVADFVDRLYNTILENGTHRAPNIETAEMAKAIENAQRDINIAFMNEVAMLANKIGIDSHAVIEAAGTKWNFIKMQPGLVGGHCISVDPYYLQYVGNKFGYTTQVINAARQTNEQVPQFIANELIKLLARTGKSRRASRLLFLGCTFKENCPDIRNSKVFDIINIISQINKNITIYDPHALNDRLPAELRPLHISEFDDKKHYDAVLLCVAHEKFKLIDFKALKQQGAVIYDIKHFVDSQVADLQY